MKKFWKYFTLTILLLLGLCCVGILYLFFVPNSSLFGICYISYSDTYKSKTYSADVYNTIIVNSNDYDVKLVESKDEKISVKVYSNSLGFVSTKNKNITITPTQNAEDGILTFNITEPTGLAFKNSSYIEVQIPSSQSYNLTLNNDKAYTTIDNSKIQIKNLSYTTNNGDLELENATLLETLKLNLSKASCNISSTVKTNNNNVVLNLTTGKFNASNSIFKNISIESNTRGVILAKECTNITQETTTAGGRIEINKVSFANIKSSSTNVYIKTITDGTSITLTDNGQVSIDTLFGSSSIVTNSGNVNIGTSNSYVNIATNSGNINISNANDQVEIKTEYGTANIHFSTDATTKYLSATLKNGKLVGSGLERINLVVTGNGRAEIDMANVKGISSIQGNTGSIFIKVNKLAKYKLTTKAEGDVRINLAQISNYGGYTTKEETTTFVNCTESTYGLNELDVATKSGSLTILDSNFA